MRRNARRTLIGAGLAAVGLMAAGCGQQGAPVAAAETMPARLAALGPEGSPVPPVLDKGWCRGHGVPESVCTRCDSSLVAQFKAAGDWCAEHDLPETQCTRCHPQVAGRWAALDPAPTAARPAAAGAGQPATSAGQAVVGAGKTAAGAVQTAGTDQTTAHDDAAPSPAAGAATEIAGRSVIRVERAGRLRALGENDPLCPVEDARIRFRDAAIVQRAGIEVAAVERRRMSASIDVPAEVQFDATRVTRITPRVGGVAREVRVEVGDTVAAGDVLAVLDSAALGEAKSALIARRQDLRVAEAELQRARTIHEGTRRLLAAATADTSAAELRQRLEGVPVGAAKARLLRAHAALELARANAAREAQLAAQHISAAKAGQVAAAELAAAEADFFATREEIAFASERSLLEAERGMEVARAALEAADRRLRILGLTEPEIVAIGGEGDGLARHELRSPAAGQVIARHVSVGEAVAEDATLLVLADPARLWLGAAVEARDLPALREGLAVHFLVDGLPGGGFSGRLTWISSEVDARTRRVPVRAELSNEAGLLRAGMFGDARIVLRDAADVVSVPRQAVQTDGCCQLAFVREAADTFVPRKVRLGARAGAYVEVLDGLEAGELIATTGSFLMKTEILKSNIGAGCCEVEPGR